MNYFNNHKIIQGDIDLSQIQILQNIGSGNSSVYSAKVKNNIMALKEIVIKSEQQASSVHRQIQLMKSLSMQNPNIIKYEGYFFTVRQMGPYNKMKFAYILMQKGITSLESIIQKKRKINQYFRDHQIINIFGTLIKTLLFLEKHNVAHCDIKPENVLIMNIEKLEIKICDIGSCKVIEKQQTQQNTLVGTVPFLAPQLIKHYGNQKAINNPFKSDVFSLGLCLIYLITFKKFKSNQRLKVDEKIYRQIIAEWIKQSKQRLLNNSLISDLLDSTLEFDQKKRIQFIQLENIFKSRLQTIQNARKQQLKTIQKEQQQRHQSCSSISLFGNGSIIQQKQMNKTFNKTGGFKNKNKTLKVETAKTQKNIREQNRSRLISKQSIHSPTPHLSNPLVKKTSMIQSLNEYDSPTKVKKISPQKIIQKQRIQLNTSLVIINKRIVKKLQDYIVNWQDKPITLNTNYWQFQNIKSLNLIINQNLKFSECVENFQKLIGIRSLIIDMRNYIGLIQQHTIEDRDQKLKNLDKQHFILSGTDLGNYMNLFHIFLGKWVKKLYIDLSFSKITAQQIQILIQNIITLAIQKLDLKLNNLNINEKVNKNIIEALAKSHIVKLSLYLQDTNININALMPWPLPKTLQYLTLNYKNNKIGLALNSLCLSLANSEIKYLNLDFSNCNLTSKEINFLFTYITKIPKLQTFILNISHNKIDDQTIRYLVSKQDEIFMKIVNFEFQIYGTVISVQNWTKIIGLSDRCFNKFKMNHFKISYDRFSQKSSLLQEIKTKILSQNIDIDILHVNNQYFTVFLRKKINPLQRIAKKGFCNRLHVNHQTQNHYICLTCKQQKQIFKNRYYCDFCINNCAHKTHNVVKIYEPAICSCAFSGDCKSDINQLICSNNYQEYYQKGYYCLKCNKQDYCSICITHCKKDHQDYVKQYKQPIFFECKHQKLIEKLILESP